METLILGIYFIRSLFLKAYEFPKIPMNWGFMAPSILKLFSPGWVNSEVCP